MSGISTLWSPNTSGLGLGAASPADNEFFLDPSISNRTVSGLDAIGRNREVALHRISAATCHRNAGQFSQAANLFQGALAGPLNDATRADVEQFLEECLAELEAASPERSVVAV
jgi:hypothetical protein